MKFKFFSKSIKPGFAIALLALTGCAEYHRRVLEDTQAVDCPPCGAFNIAIAKEYEALGKIEQSIMYDESSADYYYRKAIRSKAGDCVGPTTLDKWDLEPEKVAELEKARAQLLCALERNARCVAPELTAKAQSRFDCWVEQQSEGWQEHDIRWCRGEFYKYIKAVEQALACGAR